jgi:thioredoxin-related protein
MNKILLPILMSLCFAVGCKVQVDQELRSSLRAYASTQLAKIVIVNPAIDDEDKDEELCDGSGYITHGDGHKTKCPGCSACQSTAAAQEMTYNIYHLGAKWCTPCEQMKETTWQDAELKEYMKDNGFQLYCLDVDKEDHKKFFKYYNVKSYPTIIVLDKSNLNKPLHKSSGFKSADSIESILKGLK